jgi:Zn-dependent protease with chaperone function
MGAALVAFLYALAVAWSVGALLARLTGHGISARLGLAAWLTAMASVLACAGAALALLVGAAVAGWPGFAEVVCRSVAGRACPVVVYRSALFELPLGAAALVAALTAAVLAWRYSRAVQRARQRTRIHAEAARITGRRLPVPGDSDAGTGRRVGGRATVLIDAPQPAAYCVPGRPAAIVLTSGALAVLDRAQLTAVLAHERAHLAARHHLLISQTRGLAASFPGVPLFTRGPAEVARLAEMCADDAAARHTGRPALIAALLAMGTGMAIPATALAATAGPVTARVQRLLDPPRRGRHARYCLALSTVMVLLATASGLVATFAGPLAAYALHLG